jgi:hypothetical protein
MSISLADGIIVLAGECPVEEAETLAGLLAGHPTITVDVSQCRLAHAAVLQVLLSFAPELSGVFADPFLSQWVQQRPLAAP